MALGASVIIAILGVLIILIITYVKRIFSYWKIRGVPYIEPTIPYGNLRSFDQTKHFAFFMQSIYNRFKGANKFIGLYFFIWPVAVLTDLELIKNILVRDFSTFSDRQSYYNDDVDPLSGHLVNLTGAKWKRVRSKLTPTFTSGKMKFMFPTIIEVSNRFTNYLREAIKENNELEMKELLARFTIDVVGTCAFGIECNSVKDPNSEFLRMSRSAVDKPRHGALIQFFLNHSQWFGHLFKIKVIRDEVASFFMDVVRKTVKYREENDVHRSDFMDLLIQIRNETDPDNRLTFNEIAAQAFVFFIGGFETSSLTMTYTLYELAKNPEIQSKARREIQQVLKKYNGDFTYEAMLEVTYLDQILSETLRKYPPFTMTRRVAQKDYKVADTNHIIEKGTIVLIPLYSIHNDPDYFPNPDVYDPDRFSAEEVEKRDSMAWMAFGGGPRNCIGLRFGMMQIRIGLVNLLRNFEFSLSLETPNPLTYYPLPLILSPKGGIHLKLKPILSE